MTLRAAEAVGGALVVLASLGVTLMAAPVARRGASAGDGGPTPSSRLSFASDAKACESCHPRQAAEWRRSAMAHAADSPLFLALEMLVEEQIGRSAVCPEGGGVLRAPGEGACRDPASGELLAGSGGEGFCVKCHAPAQSLAGPSPSWGAREADRLPLSRLLAGAGRDGVGCTLCHELSVPHRAAVRERGNATWRSTTSGALFSFRPDALEREAGVANSGYALEPAVLLGAEGDELVPGGAHRRMTDGERRYLGSSKLCGTCHDVRLFGTDVLGSARGEHFKRLRNAYGEWLDYAREREARGKTAASCQSCHLSTFPGVCVPGAGSGDEPGALADACPEGTHFSEREPGALARGFVATSSRSSARVHPHFFSGVEVPLAPSFARALGDESVLDAAGTPLGARARRDLLLARSVTLTLGAVGRTARGVEVPVTVENVAAGHRVPAGFSQERELWVHLRVTDARGSTVYEVGRVERPDEDLADKRFVAVRTDDGELDALGRPLGLFGADVVDGPDVPRWDPPPDRGGTRFFGRGLASFQNGFLRCVRCIGTIDASGRCQPLSGQEGARADRFADGDYDPETGECRSNLAGREALFETYFPVGALDATRGIAKAPDAIIDTRSLPPERPVTYVYRLDAPPGPLVVEARLMFRAFPPYLLRAFAAYEQRMAALGRRPDGPLFGEDALERLDLVELARARVVAD